MVFSGGSMKLLGVDVVLSILFKLINYKIKNFNFDKDFFILKLKMFPLPVALLPIVHKIVSQEIVPHVYPRDSNHEEL